MEGARSSAWLPMNFAKCVQRVASASPDAAARALVACGSGMDARVARRLAARALHGAPETPWEDARKLLRALVLFCGPQLDEATRAAVDDALLRAAGRADAQAADVEALRDAALCRRGSADGRASVTLARAVKLFERGMRDGQDVAKAIACRSAMVACAARLQPTSVPRPSKRTWRHAEDEEKRMAHVPPTAVTMEAMDKDETHARKTDAHVQEEYGRTNKRQKNEGSKELPVVHPSLDALQGRPVHARPAPATDTSMAADESTQHAPTKQPMESATPSPDAPLLPAKTEADLGPMPMQAAAVKLPPMPQSNESDEEDSEGSLPVLVGFGEVDASDDAS